MKHLLCIVIVLAWPMALAAQDDEKETPSITDEKLIEAERAYELALDKANQEHAVKLLKVKQAYLEKLKVILKEVTLKGSVDEAKELNEKVEQVEHTVARLANQARDLTEREKTLGYRLQVHPRKAREFNGHYYMVFDKSVTWPEARRRCRRMGGYLACVTSKQENAFLKRFAKGVVWLGATDEHEEGVWRWITGEESTFTDWQKGQPDNAGEGEDWLTLNSGRGRRDEGSWGDSGPAAKRHFVCEWEH